jgi:hypothetical protein
MMPPTETNLKGKIPFGGRESGHSVHVELGGQWAAHIMA